MLRLEARPLASRTMSLLSPAIALALTVALGALLFAALGTDPVRGLSAFLVAPLADGYALTELALKATPLVLCAVGLAICFRANVWNIGAEGQFLLGAIGGGGVALWATVNPGALPAPLVVPLVLLAGAIAGAGWAGIAALLRDRFNANEILVSLLLVYVAQLLLSYFVFGPWKDPQGFNFPQTRSFDESAMLPSLVPGSRLHVGVLLVPVLVAAAWVLMSRTFAGFQLQVAGAAPAAARYAGFSTSRALWTAMLLSGGFAGLAGAMEAVGPLGQLTPHVSTGYGFTAIIVAFVGRLNPLGCVFSGLLLSMFLIGGELSQSRLGLPSALGGVFQGLLLFSLLACDTLVHYRVRLRRGSLSHETLVDGR